MTLPPLPATAFTIRPRRSHHFLISFLGTFLNRTNKAQGSGPRLNEHSSGLAWAEARPTQEHIVGHDRWRQGG